MGNLILAAAVVGAIWWLSKNGRIVFFEALIKRYGRTLGCIVLLVVCAALSMKGQYVSAVAAACFGASLLGWRFLNVFQSDTTPRISRFQSPMVDLEVDNISGAIEGIIKTGKYAGLHLKNASNAVLQELLNAALVDQDRDSASLLQAYLYRRFSGGGVHAQRDGDTGAGSRREARTISEQEAYDILGLKPGASIAEIKGAYRSLMKKLHPDHGGSDYLAARVNEAKDILLNRHR